MYVGAYWSQETAFKSTLPFVIDLIVVFNSWRAQKSFKSSLLYLVFSFFFFLFSFYLFIYMSVYCEQQEEPLILISRLLLRMRRMYVAGIRLNFH